MQPADFPTTDEAGDLSMPRRPADILVYGEHDARLLASFDQLQRGFTGRCQRFLTNNIETPGRRFLDQRQVRIRRRGDVHEIRRRRIQHCAHFVEDGNFRVDISHVGVSCRVSVTYGNQARPVQTPPRIQLDARKISRPDQRDADRITRHCPAAWA